MWGIKFVSISGGQEPQKGSIVGWYSSKEKIVERGRDISTETGLPLLLSEIGIDRRFLTPEKEVERNLKKGKYDCSIIVTISVKFSYAGETSRGLDGFYLKTRNNYFRLKKSNNLDSKYSFWDYGTGVAKEISTRLGLGDVKAIYYSSLFISSLRHTWDREGRNVIPEYKIKKSYRVL